MNGKKGILLYLMTFVCAVSMLGIVSAGRAFCTDLSQIKDKGVLRHLGVPYAHFVTGSGDGMDIEMVKLFAQHLGVRYEYVKTSWKDVIGDLSGKKVKSRGEDVEILGHVPVRGDIIANGLTRIPWRQKVVNYSMPTFPTQVWLIARADSSLRPIKPGGDIKKDIQAVKGAIRGRTVLGKAKTCLDPTLYGLKEAGAKPILFQGTLNELAPAIINAEAEATILDVPDALIALDKWPGKIKVIGPISERQVMGVGFRKDSPLLLETFNRFFQELKKDGTYLRLVKKYYPTAFIYFPDFFKQGN
ncbi:MAG: ABC transporter substrate-binding protein [Deltaproteobacteria bacterium]|nr:MAG: ABC transporter substrate-binding protein [Deltaproteobacteria bacterium]